MSYKRSHGKAFEAELRKQESPYVLYGTALPPLDDNVRDDGSFVPVWQQEVRDERGRKRLHGAFSGGWSAGYYNTVGSKEGWTPSTFKSSRGDRAKDRKDAQQRPEDYMDEEDLAEAEQSKSLQTAGSFAGLGGTEQDTFRQTGLLDVFRPTGTTVGAKLLQKMGWKQGQGIGPKTRRAARGDDGERSGPESSETHLLAPENSKIISFHRKGDFQGLGFASVASLSRPKRGVQSRQASEDEDEGSSLSIRPRAKPPAPLKSRGGIGMGVLNDTGSDDEDPFTMGPKISYNRVIGADRKQKTKTAVVKPKAGSANPLLASKPVFTSKSKSANSGFRKCSDGRLPLDGFVLAIRPAPPQKRYAPPKIPQGWVSKFSTAETAPAAPGGYQSSAEAAKSSNMDPKSRAGMLGEQQLPGKSVFDFMSSASRDRLAAASGQANLPAAGNESAPEGYRKSDVEKAKDLRSLLPSLDRDTAVQALNHRSRPYAEDESKRRRYRQFLELQAGMRHDLPERIQDEHGNAVNTEDYIKEMREFAHAAKVFRPMSGLMATRFTSSSSSSSALVPNPSDPATLLSKPAAKPADPAEEAARLGMYGPMTRTVLDFYPTRLVCKRFNVKPPAHVTVDPGGANGASSATTASEPVSKRDMDRIMQEAARSTFSPTSVRKGSVDGGDGPGTTDDAVEKSEVSKEESRNELGVAKVDVERNEALEKQRPGEDLFKAIFGSDDEDE